MDKPKSAKGVLVIITIALFLILAYLAQTVGGIIVLGIGLALFTYIVYVSGLRVHRYLLGG